MTNEPTATPSVPVKTSGTMTLKTLFADKAFESAVAQALPKHITPARFLRVALTTITRTPLLAQCDIASLTKAMLHCSSVGLEVDGRRAYLVPFRNNQRNCYECQLIIGYQGLAELAYRSGDVASIHADKVCDADVFEYDRGEIVKHVIDFKKPRGEPYAYYAIVRFKDAARAPKCEVMSKEEVNAIMRRSRAASNGPWKTDYDEMAKKTVFRRCSKWLNLSNEFRDAVIAEDDDGAELTLPPGSLTEQITAAETSALEKRGAKAEAALPPPAQESIPPPTEDNPELAPEKSPDPASEAEVAPKPVIELPRAKLLAEVKRMLKDAPRGPARRALSAVGLENAEDVDNAQDGQLQALIDELNPK
jgi:recombination protein RecT